MEIFIDRVQKKKKLNEEDLEDLNLLKEMHNIDNTKAHKNSKRIRF